MNLMCLNAGFPFNSISDQVGQTIRKVLDDLNLVIFILQITSTYFEKILASERKLFTITTSQKTLLGHI